MKATVSALSLLLALTAILIAPGPLGAEGETAKPPAPDFELADLNGVKVKLSTLKGKVVLLNFWSTNCPPCLGEIPSLNTLFDKMQGKPFVILAVTSDNRSAVQGAVRKRQIKFTVLLDPVSFAHRVYSVNSVPTTFIIDKEGKIDNKVLGAANWGDQSSVDYIQNLIDK